MPSKHIPDSTWKLVEKETVKAVGLTNRPIKDTDALNFLIIMGINYTTDKDWQSLEHLKLSCDSQK